MSLLSSIQTPPLQLSSLTQRSDIKPYLIGLAGKIDSGKSYVARELVKRYGFNIQAFADPLKEDVVAMGFDRKLVFADDKPPWLRALLQAYGLAKRAIDHDYWVKRAETAISLCRAGNVFIYQDVRFQNEVDYIQEAGGVVIRLERIDYPAISDNESETALDHADFNHTVWGESGELDDLVEYVTDCLWYEGNK